VGKLLAQSHPLAGEVELLRPPDCSIQGEAHGLQTQPAYNRSLRDSELGIEQRMCPGIGDKTQRERNTGLWSNACRSDEDTVRNTHTHRFFFFFLKVY
jgi:hypothetical protein